MHRQIILLDDYWRCDLTAINGWQQRVVDVRRFAGQRLTLRFVGATNATFPSHL